MMKSTKIFLSILFLASISINSMSTYVHASSIENQNENMSRSEGFQSQVEALIAKAKLKGLLPVIIRLKVAFTPEGYLTNSQNSPNEGKAVTAQRNAIKQSCDSVLSRLSEELGSSSAYDPAKVTVYKQIPFIAIQAGAEEIEILSQDPNVISIEEETPDEGLLSESVPHIDGDLAHLQGYSGAGQTVVVIDSGVKTDHEFFAGKIISEACYSGAFGGSLCPDSARFSTAPGSSMDCPETSAIGGCGHGTHVAGIAVGSSDSLSGVAKDANLIAIKTASVVITENGPTVKHFPSDYVQALMRVDELNTEHPEYHIAAVNLSIGGGSFIGTCDDVFNGMIKAAVDTLRAKGIATIASAGNSQVTETTIDDEGVTTHPNWNSMSRPACISSVISVGNTVDTDTDTNFLNDIEYLTDEVWGGSKVSSFTDLLAPGVDITSAVTNSTTSYGEKYGTSMSAPHVAGAFAVLRSKIPDTPADSAVDTILKVLKETGLQITDQRPQGIHTVSRIDIDDALEALEETNNSCQQMLFIEGSTQLSPCILDQIVELKTTSLSQVSDRAVGITANAPLAQAIHYYNIAAANYRQNKISIGNRYFKIAIVSINKYKVSIERGVMKNKFTQTEVMSLLDAADSIIADLNYLMNGSPL